MSPEVEDSDKVVHDARTTTLSAVPTDPAVHSRDAHHDPHHVLRDTVEDRWRWRGKIRQNPHQLKIYRVAVAIAGLFFVTLGLTTGWLPGPGGIPLVLLGLAIWSSEFAWAHRLMMWFKAQLHRFQAWPRRKQVAFWLIFFAGCGVLGYSYLLVLGPPSWFPAQVDAVLTRLPGV